MREILFRGKTEYGRWVYGSLIHVRHANYCCILNEDENDWLYPYLDPDFGTIDGRAIPVIPETVGQWTGLIDMHGQKIFEDDILDYRRWVVTYCADLNEGYRMNTGWYIQRDNFESWSELENIEEHIVLGNIHDNPELLERGV